MRKMVGIRLQGGCVDSFDGIPVACRSSDGVIREFKSGNRCRGTGAARCMGYSHQVFDVVLVAATTDAHEREDLW